MRPSPDDYILSPSILSCDFTALRDTAIELEEGGITWLHLDVMDGHFVPNLTFGSKMVGDLRKHTGLKLDCHLMITEPWLHLEKYRQEGADLITIHAEVCPHLHRYLTEIKRLGALAGVSLNPATPLSTIAHVLGDVDLVLIMAVDPGWGGQAFIPSMLEKIHKLRNTIDELGLKVRIQVDGGVNLGNLPATVRAGADWLVVGSALFGGEDLRNSIKEYQDLLLQSAKTATTTKRKDTSIITEHLTPK
jgi:ribulose-phosphate 3-epimerase